MDRRRGRGEEKNLFTEFPNSGPPGRISPSYTTMSENLVIFKTSTSGTHECGFLTCYLPMCPLPQQPFKLSPHLLRPNVKKLRLLSRQISIAEFDDAKDEFIFLLRWWGHPLVDLVELQIKFSFISVFRIHASQFTQTPTRLLPITVPLFRFLDLWEELGGSISC